MHRRLILAGLLATASAAAAAWALPPAPGHRPLHVGCASHSHGPARTAGEGRRLVDARALNREARRAQR